MNILFLLATALTVSADSFFCGFSLSLGSRRRTMIVCGIVLTLTVCVLCAAANLLGNLLSGIFTEEVAAAGGMILIAVGVYNMIYSGKEEFGEDHILNKSLIVGFAVGLDGAAATLSLSLMGYAEFYVPLLITATHFVTIVLGSALSETKFLGKLKNYRAAPPLMLIALGAYKLVSAFL